LVSARFTCINAERNKIRRYIGRGGPTERLPGGVPRLFHLLPPHASRPAHQGSPVRGTRRLRYSFRTDVRRRRVLVTLPVEVLYLNLYLYFKKSLLSYRELY